MGGSVGSGTGDGRSGRTPRDTPPPVSEVLLETCSVSWREGGLITRLGVGLRSLRVETGFGRVRGPWKG